MPQEFGLHFFHDSNLSGPLINRLKFFRIGFEFAEIFDYKVRNIQLRSVHDTAESTFFGLANKIFFLKIFSFMIDVVTPKRISLDCPFKSNQRLTKISILTLQCEV